MEGLPVAVDVRREADPGVLAQDALEQPLAVFERHAEQRAPVEVEQIERLVHEASPPTAIAEPLLEQAEVGLPVLVERDDLAVDDRLPRLDPASAG